MTFDPYIVRRESLPLAFPPGIEPPALLRDFADWLDGRPWGSLGCYRLQGTLSDEAPIVDGSALRREFSLFLYLPDGSLVGLWHPDGVPSAASPVVGLGSEGDAAVLAGSLDGFLVKLSRNAFAASAWSDLAPADADEEEEFEDEPETAMTDGGALGDLAAWLLQRIGPERLNALADEEPDQSVFPARMGAWMHQREAYWAEHPILREIGQTLAAHRPRGENPWDRTRFRAAVVGTLYEAQVYRAGRQSFPEARAIEPLLRALREAQRADDPDLGLWFEVEFALDREGYILPRFDYQGRPAIRGAPAPIEEARADLRRAPRPARWVPDWLGVPVQAG